MLKGISILGSLVLILALAGAALAFGARQSQPQPEPQLQPESQYSDLFWQATYWNNPTMSGSPALVRSESDIAYDWGSASPGFNINADRFSARWTRYIDLTPGTYRFTTASDDGMRAWVDNVLVINQWDDHTAQITTVDQTLTAGAHLLVVEYYESVGLAVAKFSWDPIKTPIYNWRGEYFNNVTLDGAPALVRDDGQIDFNWGNGSPAQGIINADHFSVRWTHNISPTPGLYRFTAISDDGIRVWADGALIIDQWNINALQTFTADWVMTTGSHLVVVEYFENDGWAAARLSWDLIEVPIPTWRAEYFNNTTLSASPVLVREDAQVYFNWGNDSPMPGIVNANGFSAQWTGQFDLPAGAYRFILRVDDGARLWVNDHLLIDEWRDQEVQTYNSDIYLPGGPIPIKLEYYENAGNATVQLAWTLSASPETVVVDDARLGLDQRRDDGRMGTSSEGYEGRQFWTRNSDEVHPKYN